MTVPGTSSRPETVSVVLVNFRGADDTIVAARSLEEVDWPRELLEVVVVDNDSGDGSADRIERELPGVRVVRSPSNLGFAGGCNLGVEECTGEYVAFLNNDARAGRDWVRAAVAEMSQDVTVAAVASRVLDWAGERVDYVDGSLTWFGMGYKREVGQPDSGAFDTPRDVLFGTGAALFVRRDVFREVGGFDESFFMFYEDVDLGWRLNLLGYRVRYVPTSVAYHRHHATMAKFGAYRENYLLERNALAALYKNMGDELVARVLPAALALTVRRSFARAQVDTSSLDLERGLGSDGDSITLPKDALTGPFAIDGFVDRLPALSAARADLQARRRRSDRELIPLFRETMEPALDVPRYVSAYRALVDAFSIADVLATRHRILVVTGEPLAGTMAGPAIRAWEMARHLAADHEVRLVSTVSVDLEHPDFAVEFAAGVGLREPTQWADVIVFQGFLLEDAPWLFTSSAIVVADVYDPMHLEQLEQARELGAAQRQERVSRTTEVLNRQLARADLVLCASQKQRDFWLGQLAGQGRVNPLTYDEDEGMAGLISVVPFGLPDEPPVQRRHGIRGVVPGIGPDEKVIVWGGGVYNWFDPLTLIRAVGALVETHPDVRLYFLGMKHPNPGVPAMRMASDAVALADELGLTNRHVVFNEGWVPYEERADYLLDADLGVSTHLDHIETEFSFRTRILDYLWAGLPVVCTEGDSFGELVGRHRLGRTVPAQDVAALVQALEDVLYDPEVAESSRAAVASLAQRFRWSQVLAPLVDFCRFPRRAADLAQRLPEARTAGRPVDRREQGLRADLALVRRYLREGGVRELSRRALGRITKARENSAG